MDDIVFIGLGVSRKPSLKKGNSFAYMNTFFLHELLMLGPAIGSIIVMKIFGTGSFPKWKWGKFKHYLMIAVANLAFWMIPVF